MDKHEISQRAAMLAWDDLQRNVRVGPYKTVTFADPLINATLRAGWHSWLAVCDDFAKGESGEEQIRQRFLKTYMAMARRRQIGDEETRALGGLSTGQVCRKTGEIIAPIPKVLGKPRELPPQIAIVKAPLDSRRMLNSANDI